MVSSTSETFHSIEQQFQFLNSLIDRLQSFIKQARPASLPLSIYETVNQLGSNFERLRRQVQTMEDERRNLHAHAQISQVVNSSLELDEVLQIVMDTIIRLTGAERGFLMLSNERNEMTIHVARNWEQESLESTELTVSRTVIYRVVKDMQPLLTTNAQEDPRFTGQESIIAYNLRSILCVPLKRKEQLIGVIYADNRIRSGLFTQKELDMLVTFANQAAIAIENARLFASVRKTLEEVTGLKNLMDNVFTSISSGVLTADVQERILMCNKSAEIILGQTASELLGHELNETLSSIQLSLKPHFQRVLKTDQSVLGLEISPTLPDRGEVDLRFSLSPLKDSEHTTQGVAIVLEDLTEKKKLEAERRLFEKMVSPAVIEQLDPDSIQLGGQRNQITVMFADIRGFTSFSETVEPEELVFVLNRYLAKAAEAVLVEGGTVDKFLGDAVMAWFNAPIPQADHTLRAVRAALAIRDSLPELHRNKPISSRLSFGIGIHIGDAVLGMIGTEQRMDFTAIGDVVNTTKRIQENAAPGQILISREAYERVREFLQVVPVDPIIAKGKRDPVIVYEVLQLK